MVRAVYIGGLVNGKRAASGVVEALAAEYYDDVDAFTFSEATDQPKAVRITVRGADAFTQSAGIMALAGTHPDTIRAFSAPMPTKSLRILAKTAVKMTYMHTPGIGICSPHDIPAIITYNLSAMAELIAHPADNLGQIRNIRNFNALEAAVAAQRDGVPTSLIYSHGDEYFGLSAEEEASATAAGVGVVRIPGIHDELVIRPAATLRAIMGQRG